MCIIVIRDMEWIKDTSQHTNPYVGCHLDKRGIYMIKCQHVFFCPSVYMSVLLKLQEKCPHLVSLK